MPKIRFTRDHLIKDEHRGTDKETRYKKGHVMTVSEASATHFLNRRVAEIVPVQKAKQAKKQEPKTIDPNPAKTKTVVNNDVLTKV